MMDPLRSFAMSTYRGDMGALHGPDHWDRVAQFGQRICLETDADPVVVRYFAYLHDVCRIDDGADAWHGPCAADRLKELPPELAVLSPEQHALLDEAIRFHTEGRVSDEPTIGACWDADRLDLGRAGIMPSEHLMSTEPGVTMVVGMHPSMPQEEDEASPTASPRRLPRTATTG